MTALGTSRGSTGMALLLVLWCTAALAVLVTGMIGAQRSELRLAAMARQRVDALAQGQAAIQRVVQQIAGTPVTVDRFHRRQVTLDGQSVEVEVMPSSGLIDLGRAPMSLLQDLFIFAGGMPDAAAASLAVAVEAMRQQPARVGGPRGFEAPEELLALPSFDFALLDRIAPLVTSAGSGGGRVNPMCAPRGVLAVLARGNASAVERFVAARDAGATSIDTTSFAPGHVDASTGTRFRLTAEVRRSDGLIEQVVQDIDARSPEPGGAPWRVLRSFNRLNTAGQP